MLWIMWWMELGERVAEFLLVLLVFCFYLSWARTTLPGRAQ